MDYVNVDIYSGYVHDVDDDGDVTHLHLLSSVLPVLDCWTWLLSKTKVLGKIFCQLLTLLTFFGLLKFPYQNENLNLKTNTWQPLDAMQKKIPC